MGHHNLLVNLLAIWGAFSLACLALSFCIIRNPKYIPPVLPCKLCGSLPERHDLNDRVWFECERCGEQADKELTEGFAVESWNKQNEVTDDE